MSELPFYAYLLHLSFHCVRIKSGEKLEGFANVKIMYSMWKNI
jgi:hypothetical protein